MVLHVEPPSPGFMSDNADLRLYLPETVRLSRAAVDAARTGARPRELEPAIACAAVLGYPDTWPARPWGAISPS